MATQKATNKAPKVKKQEKSQESNGFRDEIILLFVLALALLLFVSVFTEGAGLVGLTINKIIFGLVGTTAYVLPFFMIILTLFKLANKKSTLAKRKIIFSSLLAVVFTVVVQIIQGEYGTLFKSLPSHFTFASSFKKGGGIIGGFFADLLLMLFGKWGTYIVLTAMSLVLLILLTEKSFVKLVKRISHSFYTRVNEVISHQKNKEKKVKGEKKKETSFTIEHFEEDTDENHEKQLQYASQDPSSIMSRVTLENEKNEEEMSIEEEGQRVEPSEERIEEIAMTKESSETTNSEPLNVVQEKNPSDFTYEFPPIELLQKSKVHKGAQSKQTIIDNANKLQQTLENFGVKANILNVSCGPTVTRYEVQPEQGVKVSKIVNLTDDIKLNLAASDIRIEAPIPGKAAVGIEVPNKENQAVLLRDIIEAEAFSRHTSSISFALGKDIAGKEIVADITKMPHLLIAGATGSGKSVCINTLITSIIYKAKPSDVKLMMIDPKMVELSVYNGIPHLMIPVVTDPKKASSALSWAVAEMTDRYKKFADFNVRDIKGYNDKIKDEEELAKLPQIVIIVDELADLMMIAPGDVEDAICRLAQMARAAGIHLVIATQRPSVNVITGLIKANIPSRIAFSVSSGTDSRTILDMNGAEKLLGKGDMLFYPVGYSKPLRIQGAFISDKEVSNIVEFVKNNQVDATYNDEVIEVITNATSKGTGQEAEEEKDEYFEEAIKLVLGKQKASISMIQRMFRVGFNRASRLMDQLHEAGIVGPDEGSKPRKVLMTEEEWANRDK